MTGAMLNGTVLRLWNRGLHITPICLPAFRNITRRARRQGRCTPPAARTAGARGLARPLTARPAAFGGEPAQANPPCSVRAIGAEP